MLSFYRQYAANVHSQNGESGIINEAVRRIGIEKGHCVEVGANDGYWMSNTAHLIEHGWTGKFIEADYDLYQRCAQNWSFTPQVKAICSRVDGRNVNAFVGHDCDVLSLDTDGSDYQIFKGLNAKPKIVIIEIDSSIPPYVAGAEGFNPDGAAGYAEMVMLGYRKGYFLLCHTGNLVFVAKEYAHLFPEVADGNPLTDALLYFNQAWLKEPLKIPSIAA